MAVSGRTNSTPNEAFIGSKKNTNQIEQFASTQFRNGSGIFADGPRR
jgi:hypothetical protein